MNTPWSRPDEESDHLNEPKKHRQYGSLYVELFDNIYSIVLEKEKHLFSEEELGYLEALHGLPYSSRFLLIRLSLRKRGKWHTLSSIEKSYGTELGSKEDISRLIDRLCDIRRVVQTPESDCNLIDLTEEDSGHLILYSYSYDTDLTTERGHKFAEDESAAALSELLDCLPLDSLKKMGKQMKISSSAKTRTTLTRALILSCSRQTILTAYFHKPRSQTSDKPYLSTRNTKESPSQSHFKRQILKEIGRCVRLRTELLEILDRLNIIFLRSTSYDLSLFLPALLNAFKKRFHASPNYVRTRDVFPSRQIFLDFRKALALEAQLSDILKGDPSSTNLDEDLNKVAPNLRKAQSMKKILEIAYSSWKEITSTDDPDVTRSLFDRFRYEHVLARIMDRSSDALGTLKEYDLLVEILESLLKQRRWGIGRRGAWYDRLALIHMTHMGNDVEVLTKAMKIVRCGLKDEATRSIYRPRLERRLVRLENRLRIPINERHRVVRRLNNAKETFIGGSRICDDSIKSSLGANRTKWSGRNDTVSVEEFVLEYYSNLGYKGYHTEGRILSTIYGLLFWDIIFSSIPGAFETPYQTAPLDIMDAMFYSARRDAIDARIIDIRSGNARELVSNILEREGSKRPGCIGVYWTLEQDGILEIIEVMESLTLSSLQSPAHRKRKCIDNDALANICRVISEDYTCIGGGVPDLIIWKPHTKDCRFVEVKSENDRLQENQRFWIDMLLRAGFSVELCNVTNEEDSGKLKKKSDTGSRRGRADSKANTINSP